MYVRCPDKKTFGISAALFTASALNSSIWSNNLLSTARLSTSIYADSYTQKSADTTAKRFEAKTFTLDNTELGESSFKRSGTVVLVTFVLLAVAYYIFSI